MINLATAPSVGATASQTSGYQGNTFPASNAIDGNYSDFSHTNGDGSDNFPSLTVDLHNDYALSEIDVSDREDCCGSRLTDFSVTVFAPDHTTQTFSQTYFASSGSPGSTPATQLVITLPAGVTGEFVTVHKFNDPSNTTNPNPSGDNVVLALGELQVIGNGVPLPEPSSMILGSLGAVGLFIAARRRRKA